MTGGCRFLSRDPLRTSLGPCSPLVHLTELSSGRITGHSEKAGAADLRHTQDRLGFQIPLKITEAITGHIAFFQIRKGAVDILDYKLDAPTKKPIQQLTIYALAPRG